MFNEHALSKSGVKVYKTLIDNVAGLDPYDTKNPLVQDVLRKHRERGRANIQSENSEDALLASWGLACSKMPNAWILDFLRVSVNEHFAETYAPHVADAQIRFWVQHPAPECLQTWLRTRLLTMGEDAIKHLDITGQIRAMPRLEKIIEGDPHELPERNSEIDLEIRLGKELLVFVEAKLYSDCSASTFSPGRTQILRNIELLEDVARREGFNDARFILLTLERNGKVHPNAVKAMKRYRGSDMRLLRSWDEMGNWEAIKRDLPHRFSEPDEYFQKLSKRMGWASWTDCLKILAHHAARPGGLCEL